MNAILEHRVVEMRRPLEDNIRSACKRIAPLWPLKTFVAVNPFIGLSERPFIAGVQLMQRVGHGDMLMPSEFYREQIASGRLRERDFLAALELAPKTLPPDWAEQVNFGSLEELDQALAKCAPAVGTDRILTFADFLDGQNGGDWSGFVVEEISKWCSAYYDEGQSSWRVPWKDLGLFAAWKAAARLDANPEMCGLRRFREFIATLPEDHLDLIAHALIKLGVPDKGQVDFLHRQLMSISGWSSYVQFRVRDQVMCGEADDSLVQLLAVRLIYDLALRNRFGEEPQLLRLWEKQTERLLARKSDFSAELLARHVAQQALECGYQSGLMAKLKSRTHRVNPPGPKSLQAIFCIDVRSEIIRRSLESQSDDIETLGFAGFFGVAIEYLKFGQAVGGAQCPVLLRPKFKVREALHHADARREGKLLRELNFRQTVNGAWNSFKTSAISCFSFVETAGLWFGLKLAGDALALAAPEAAYAANRPLPRSGPKIEREVCACDNYGNESETGIVLEDQIAVAAGALRNMGLVCDFAKVVLFCGHGSATVNNPYGSALDCGACGGHSGDANARILAAILNQAAVREGLKAHSIQIPAETIFIAGLHNTTTDEIVVYDDEALFATETAEFEKIRGWLSAASRQARRERAASLGLTEVEDAQLDESIFAHSRDWSQVRPEWGLANNAAFIAAPRECTKQLDLAGRAFLHNYDARQDLDNSVLELIMVAPMVVASWINLQYYGSTVDNRLFGSGNKVIHNVVGTFGVWQGNGGDLQPGLPMQSVHDGKRWRHEPLRLNVFIEAECGKIETVLAKHANVRELIENGWVNLFAMDSSRQRFWRYCGKGFVEEIEH